jgi:hypothetical protein
MLDDYSNGCARARSFGIAAKIKIMGESLLVFAGLWFGTHVLFMRLPSKKYKIVSWKKNDYEDLDDLLVSFRLCFIIAEELLYIYHVLFAMINIYGIDGQKKYFLFSKS